MDEKTAIDNLYVNYKQHGVTREQIVALFADGYQKGFTVSQTYTGLKLAFSEVYNTHELFTVNEMADVLGCTEQEVIEEIEKAKEELEQRGENFNDYFMERQQGFKFIYYPN